MPLKAKYTFSCAPINRKMPFVCTMFLKKERQYSKGELIPFDWLCGQVGWPFFPTETILDLVHLEQIHDVFDLYLWLSYRWPAMALGRITMSAAGSPTCSLTWRLCGRCSRSWTPWWRRALPTWSDCLKTPRL